MPGREATWWHWSTADDSIQLRGEAKTVTVAWSGAETGTGILGEVREGMTEDRVEPGRGMSVSTSWPHSGQGGPVTQRIFPSRAVRVVDPPVSR
ncbi:hypothetical protein Kisp02_42420 [Kineosporia sp. NBRC 101731]|nr:hypothetical protein Kisp02_42420 [Kineosporia sp. NBRC 101731]